jgi:hypothetical protein
MSGLSLYRIEDALLQLLQAREEILTNEQTPETPAELAQVETALAEYVTAEIRKVDGIHAYLKQAKATAEQAKAEAAEMRARAERIENGMARLKEFCLQAMQLAGMKRIDGTAGRYLLRKGNGGKEPLVVAQPELVPDEYRILTLKVRADKWDPEAFASAGLESIAASEPEISNELIRKALEGGSAVPGAHLEARGQHIIAM